MKYYRLSELKDDYIVRDLKLETLVEVKIINSGDKDSNNNEQCKSYLYDYKLDYFVRKLQNNQYCFSYKDYLLIVSMDSLANRTVLIEKIKWDDMICYKEGC